MAKVRDFPISKNCAKSDCEKLCRVYVSDKFHIKCGDFIWTALSILPSIMHKELSKLALPLNCPIDLITTRYLHRVQKIDTKSIIYS